MKMNKTINLLSHEDRFSLATLPDGWTGIVNGNTRVLSSSEANEYFFSSEKKFDASSIKKIVMISPDNFMNSGIRSVLENIKNIRLKVTTAIEDKKNSLASGNCDLLILVECENLRAVDIINYIILNRNDNEFLHIIVLAEESYEFFDHLSDKWGGFVTIHCQVLPQSLEEAVNEMLRSQYNYPKFENEFTQRQWNTLSLLSHGLNLAAAGHVMGISEKTVSLHKKKAFKRISVRHKCHQAWLMNAIQNSYE